MNPLSRSVATLMLLTSLIYFGCDKSNQRSKESSEAQQSVARNTPKLSPKEQYVSDARELVKSMITISESITESESADHALSEMKKLQPKAQEMGQAAAKLLAAVGDDKEARNELVRYFQTECPSDSDLEPLIRKLGPGKDSKYPEIIEIAGELLESSMHNYF